MSWCFQPVFLVARDCFFASLAEPDSPVPVGTRSSLTRDIDPGVLNDITNGSNPNCGSSGFPAVKGESHSRVPRRDMRKHRFNWPTMAWRSLLERALFITSLLTLPSITLGWDPSTGLGTPNYPKMLELFLSLP